MEAYRVGVIVYRVLERVYCFVIYDSRRQLIPGFSDRICIEVFPYIDVKPSSSRLYPIVSSHSIPVYSTSGGGCASAP